MIVPAVPEITEEVVHESIDARTSSLPSLRELGPPDLVHLLRQQTRGGSRQAGIYHHVTGVDASSSASLAAYLNTLILKDQGPQPTAKIVEGIHCCYNAFSRLDMRVHITIPGSVEAYCVDEQDEKHKTTEELWLEAYLCSVLRAYAYADDGSGDTIRRIMGCRRFNPISDVEAETRFLDAAERLFFRGWHLGSDSVVQTPNNVSNHLTAGLLKYFETTGRYQSGINLFDRLRNQNKEVASLLAKLLFMGSEEVEGIRVLYHALKERPMDYVMLDTQAEFLLKKAQMAATQEQRDERLQMALGCADRGTIAAPSEFGTWARLAQVYVAMEDWENALTILNSCPMFTYQDKDAPLMPEPKDVFLPTLPESRLDEIDSEPESRFSERVDPNLQGLRAAAYKGTFKQAYSILTEMTAKIGWDQLLRIRSNVFVMEEEYRNERHDASPPSKRSPSTDVLRGSPEPATNGGGEEEDDDGSKVEGEDEKAEQMNGETAESVEKPVPAEVKAESESGAKSEETPSKLNNKRLCERWLDALFMVLYDDLKVYTIWRTKMAQYRAQQMTFRQSAEEWEILGSLAERLHHHKDAVEAYEACLSQRFSPKAFTGILRDYVRQGETQKTVASAIRLVTWQYRWYSEFSPDLIQTIRTLIEDQGAVKVRSIIQATNLPQGALDLAHQYAAWCATFRSGGGDT